MQNTYMYQKSANGSEFQLCHHLQECSRINHAAVQCPSMQNEDVRLITVNISLVLKLCSFHPLLFVRTRKDKGYLYVRFNSTSSDRG